MATSTTMTVTPPPPHHGHPTTTKLTTVQHLFERDRHNVSELPVMVLVLRACLSSWFYFYDDFADAPTLVVMVLQRSSWFSKSSWFSAIVMVMNLDKSSRHGFTLTPQGQGSACMHRCSKV
jgi:hypothetical protein